MLFLLVSPRVVSDVTGGPYHGTPSSVLIDRWPPWFLAALPGGHTPFVPAWMCIACTLLSRPVVLTVTVTSWPLSRTFASPTPSTWFVGTGASWASSGRPVGLGGGESAFALSPDEPDEPRTTTATTIPAAARSAASSAIRMPRARLRESAGSGVAGVPPAPPPAAAATGT